MDFNATTRPPNGNPGIVPPWLQKPPVITLPVEPEVRVTLLAGAPLTIRSGRVDAVMGAGAFA